MKIAALLASAFVATAVQAGQVTLYYCIEGQKCHNADVESRQCTDLQYPGTVKSIQNSGDCYLFPIHGCQGPPRAFPRGSYDHQDVYAQSVVCFEQSLPRNLAPAVQAEAVDVKYCYLDGTCVDTTVEPFECTNLEESGPLSSIQNGADCELHEYFNCHGRFFNVKRGAHDIKELKGKIVGSLLCGRPGLRRNPANQELFESLRRDWWKVARFLVDLMEPMKRFVNAESTDGNPPPVAAAWNPYNELDMSQPMNRHAVISQVQRFFKSIIEVFRQADLDVGRFDMNTRLETDAGKSLVTTVALKRINRPDIAEDETAESWIFVNGVAGEFYWNHLAVQKLQDYFFDPDQPEDITEEVKSRRTTITGVFNRSDGVIWDLIECGGERRPHDTNKKNIEDRTSKPTLSSRTASSREAQGQLSQILREALSDSKTSKRDIIMIAHSQGCLLLRLALEQIHSDADSETRSVMLTHLRIFTFGNPAYDWDVHAYTASTEHFANELDYVAKLGVLRLYSSDPNEAVNNELHYCSRCKAGDDKHLLMPKQAIFVNNQHQTGHLFGSQYSLRAKDYDCVNLASESRLLPRAWRRA